MIIIEISGKSRQNSVCSSSSSPSMGDGMPTTRIENSSPATTFECHTHWKDSFYNLHDYYKDESLCDITVAVGNKNILCHRLVLACCSPYFKAMLTSNMKESRQECITIQDIDEQALEALIGFMYTSKILLTVDTVQKLLYASSVLQIEVVAEACCEFMKNHLHPTNCLGVRAFAEQHGRFELVKAADKFTHDHFLEVLEQEEFRTISFQHLATIVESSDVLVEREAQVYEAVMRWVKQDAGSREQYLPKLISKVRCWKRKRRIAFKFFEGWAILQNLTKFVCVCVWGGVVVVLLLWIGRFKAENWLNLQENGLFCFVSFTFSQTLLH